MLLSKQKIQFFLWEWYLYVILIITCQDTGSCYLLGRIEVGEKGIEDQSQKEFGFVWIFK